MRIRKRYDYKVTVTINMITSGAYSGFQLWGRESNGGRSRERKTSGEGIPIPSGEEVWEGTMPPS